MVRDVFLNLLSLVLQFFWTFCVIVKLQNHAAKGITEKDFSLAKEIERVIQWKPGEEGILDGTPEDPRFKYIKYD